jgi:hypothetical protein
VLSVLLEVVTVQTPQFWRPDGKYYHVLHTQERPLRFWHGRFAVF